MMTPTTAHKFNSDSLTKLLKSKLITNPPPAWTLSRQVRNPFSVGPVVWSKRTGIELGRIMMVSLPTFDNYHWALVGDFLFIFDYDLGDKYTLINPALSQPPVQLPLSSSASDIFIVGQRLFYKKDYRVPQRQYVGVVQKVYPPLHENGDWRCRTSLSENFTSTALYSNTLKVGQRFHREDLLCQ